MFQARAQDGWGVGVTLEIESSGQRLHILGSRTCRYVGKGGKEKAVPRLK